MEDFKAEVEARQVAWRQKAKEEALKIWQPAMEKATNELVDSIATLVESHSAKLEIVRQAIRRTTSDDEYVNDLILDEMEVAAARTTRNFEDYLQQGLVALGSDRQLVNLRDALPALADGDHSKSEMRSGRGTFKSPHFESPSNDGLPQGTLTATESRRSLPSTPGRPVVKTPVTPKTPVHPADLEISAMREQKIQSALEDARRGSTQSAAAAKWGIPVSTLHQRLRRGTPRTPRKPLIVGSRENPIIPDKGTLSWKDVEGNDYVVTRYGLHYAIRCETAPGENTFHFKAHPFECWDVKRHLTELPEEGVPCHGESDCGKFSEAEVIKKLGYQVVLPHPNNTEDGERKNKKWVADNNKVMRRKAEVYLATHPFLDDSGEEE
ncbi:hypothetical protein B0T16DRAFT_514786 [Cercophora newfieldiana]|uniref:HTH psq-type domain-containing protein n=1 Tax=Cercophora newfieldiana TaxID=92897 RepID=A0AA40CJ65_9PEZI|nr:hypothetical protein B0T16DRAFT_514786 [Cercophora newfieldiana]